MRSIVSSFRLTALASTLTALAMSLIPAISYAQASKAGAEEIPAPVEERLESKDLKGKLILKLTYYPSKLGKEAAVVILMHGYGGSRADYDVLANVLQRQGHAVVVPDLRGHGDSTTVVTPAESTTEISYDKFKTLDFGLMVTDLDVIKRWLLQKNNEEELNLEQIVLVGADMSTITAMNWALRDWEAPVLLSYKNAQDVKAAILLSPEASYKGTSYKLAVSHGFVGHKMPTLIVVGKQNSSANEEAKRLSNILERQHISAAADKKAEAAKTPDERNVKLFQVETKLQGTNLVDPAHPEFKVIQEIAKFIATRVKSKAENHAWSARIKP